MTSLKEQFEQPEKKRLLLEVLQLGLERSDDDEVRTQMEREEQIQLGVELVSAALYLKQYQLLGDSDGGNPQLRRTCDGVRVDVPDDVMQRLISMGLIRFFLDS